MVFEKVHISTLKHPERNVRMHPENQLAEMKRSLEQFEQIRPAVVDQNNTILAGNGMVAAMREMGYEYVEVIRKTDLSNKQKRKLMLADNRLSSMGYDNIDILKEILGELDGDYDIAGYDDEFLSKTMKQSNDVVEKVINEQSGYSGSFAYYDDKDKKTEIVEDDSEKKLPINPKSKLGDIYQLGRHRLICGDSTNRNTIQTLMNGVQADLLLTDPPYNVGYEGKTKDALTIENDKMEDDEFKVFLIKAFTIADSVMKKGASFYIWHADSKGYPVRDACHTIGWQVRQCLIWNKNAMVLGRQNYQWKHEPCLYGWKDGATHCWRGDRDKTTVLECKRPSSSREHPTMKPIELMAFQIKNNTWKDWVVLDPFGGSGTTLLAAEQTGRICYMCELSPQYIDVIIDRYEELTGDKAALIYRGESGKIGTSGMDTPAAG